MVPPDEETWIMVAYRRLTKVLAGVALLGLFGCGREDGGGTMVPEGAVTGPQPVTGENLVVGFAQVGAESAWRTAETASIKAEAAERGVDLRFSDAQGKQENQIKALRAFIAQGVDAILLAPVVETGWGPVLREAKQAGIPVVLVDRGIETDDDSLYTTLIASDLVAGGEDRRQGPDRGVAGHAWIGTGHRPQAGVRGDHGRARGHDHHRVSER
jgi:ABC-type sugar transport system substrate-binding protein